LSAYRQLSFTDALSSWMNRGQPFVTPQLNAANGTYLDGTGASGADWQPFLTHKCLATVHNATATIPPEAPHTQNAVHVEVLGTLTTTCRTGAGRPDQTAWATLTVVKPAGLWLVSAREQ